MPGERKDGKLPDAHLAAAYLQERRDVRYAIPIELEVSGINQKGAVFHERTFTRDVSEWGCSFVLSIELKADNIISICMATRDADERSPKRQSLFQVLRVTQEEDGWLVGAWKMDGESVWGTELGKLVCHEEGTTKSRQDRMAEHGERQRQDSDQ